MGTSADGDRLDETELVLRARRGEGPAWEAVVRLHQEAVFRYAYLLLGDPADAEDVAQETFVRLLKSFDRFDPARPLRPWLIRIARNLARNRWRSASRALRALDRWREQALVEGSSFAPAADRSPATASADLEQAVRRLRESERQMIYLRYYLDLSVEETGHVLGIPPGTVKSRTSRAVDRLRQVVRRDFPALQEALQG